MLNFKIETNVLLCIYYVLARDMFDYQYFDFN